MAAMDGLCRGVRCRLQWLAREVGGHGQSSCKTSEVAFVVIQARCDGGRTRVGTLDGSGWVGPKEALSGGAEGEGGAMIDTQGLACTVGTSALPPN